MTDIPKDEKVQEAEAAQPATKAATKPAIKPEAAASNSAQLPTKEQFFEILMPVEDPEIRISIVDLGLIYDVIANDDNTVTVKMTLTTPACPYGEMLIAQVKDTIEKVEGVKEAIIELVWEPTWDPREMASDYAKDQLGIW